MCFFSKTLAISINEHGNGFFGLLPQSSYCLIVRPASIGFICYGSLLIFFNPDKKIQRNERAGRSSFS